MLTYATQRHMSPTPLRPLHTGTAHTHSGPRTLHTGSTGSESEGADGGSCVPFNATERLLGSHPDTGQPVYVRLGPYGLYVQAGDAPKKEPKKKKTVGGKAAKPKGAAAKGGAKRKKAAAVEEDAAVPEAELEVAGEAAVTSTSDVEALAGPPVKRAAIPKAKVSALRQLPAGFVYGLARCCPSSLPKLPPSRPYQVFSLRCSPPLSPHMRLCACVATGLYHPVGDAGGGSGAAGVAAHAGAAPWGRAAGGGQHGAVWAVRGARRRVGQLGQARHAAGVGGWMGGEAVWVWARRGYRLRQIASESSCGMAAARCSCSAGHVLGALCWGPCAGGAMCVTSPPLVCVPGTLPKFALIIRAVVHAALAASPGSTWHTICVNA